MSVAPVRFAVVGCGNIGMRHLTILGGTPGAEVVAVCDTDSARVQAVGERFLAARAFTDYATMLRETAPEVVAICTPHHLHASMAVAAAEAGFHALIEKPLALSTADAQAVIAAGRAHNVHMMVVKQNRHNAPVEVVTEALQSGRLGRVLAAQCTVVWQRPASYYTASPWRGRLATEGGALWTQVSHFIDLMVWWCGDITRASARLARQRYPMIETEDTGTAEVSFAGGAIGTLFWTTCGVNKNAEGSLTLVAEHGTVKIGGPYLNKFEYWEMADGGPAPPLREAAPPNQYPGYQGSSSEHPRVIAQVIRELRDGGSAIVDAGEGLKTVQAIETIYAAAGWEGGR